MECTYIRIGNNAYEKQNGSYGLTTLKNKHVRIQGPLMRFSFKGKKGIYHDISLRSRKLSRIVQACRDIPGKELFQYYDEHGARRPIDSGMVNSYIKTISSGDFTAKDFRTWAGSLHALNAFRQLGCCDTENETKKRVVEAVDTVARYLGNTRSICRKYYIHPALIEAYSDRSLEKYLAAEPGLSCPGPDDTLTAEERVLMTILKTGSTDIVLK